MKTELISPKKNKLKCLLHAVLAPSMTIIIEAIFTLLSFLILGTLFSTSGAKSETRLWVQLFSKLTFILVLYFYCSKIFKFNWHSQQKRNIQFAVVIVSLIVIWWFLKIFILYGSYSNLKLSFHLSEESILLLLKSVLIAPILEELLFRKWMFDYMKSNAFSPLFILIFSSLIFFLWHGDLQRWDLIISGLIFGAVYLKGKNIVYPIVIHALGNLLSSIFIVN